MGSRRSVGSGDAGLVRVQQHRILSYTREYLRNSQYLQSPKGDSIVAWGWRVQEWPLDSARAVERVAEHPDFRFSNGSVVMDVNGDGEEELIVGRYAREEWQGHELLWYERAAGGMTWREHKIGWVESPGKEMPHDMQPFSVAVPNGEVLRGFVAAIGREDMYLFEMPGDPTREWKRHFIGRLPDAPQSGMRIADINGDGRPDIVTGMFWVECPPDPRSGEWRFHRYGDWDRRHATWGGMNKHAVADFDGDGALEIVVDEAENPESKLVVYKRNQRNPEGLWEERLLDEGLYCPHTLEVTDLNGDGQPDLVLGEMDAGGWNFPMTPSPKLYAYLNRGGLQFERVQLGQGFGIHEGKMAPKMFEGQPLLFGNSTTQPWFDAMVTNLSTYILECVPEDGRADRVGR